jgi:hypothetical protein
MLRARNSRIKFLEHERSAPVLEFPRDFHGHGLARKGAMR